jgi:hypothetical protein
MYFVHKLYTQDWLLTARNSVVVKSEEFGAAIALEHSYMPWGPENSGGCSGLLSSAPPDHRNWTNIK